MSADANTVSLLHFDNGLTDESGKIWTAYNGATVSSTQSKFGDSSLYLNGSQYITTPDSTDFAFGSNDFTIEGWIYPTNNAANIWYDWVTKISGSYGEFYIAVYNDILRLGLSSNGTGWNLANPNSTFFGSVPTTKFSHFAVCRNGGYIYLFLNGNLNNTISVGSSSLYNNSSPVSIGALANGNEKAQGYIDEPRISNVCRWTSSFTPPTTPYDSGYRLFPQII